MTKLTDKHQKEVLALSLYGDSCINAVIKKLCRKYLLTKEDGEDLKQIAILATVEKWSPTLGASARTFCIQVLSCDAIDLARTRDRRARLLQKWVRRVTV